MAERTPSGDRTPSNRLTIHRDMIRAGQPRPYADSVYEAVLTYEGNGPMMPGFDFRPAESLVRKHARTLIREWSDDPKWHEARLDSIHEEAPGVWRVRIVEPFLD